MRFSRPAVQERVAFGRRFERPGLEAENAVVETGPGQPLGDGPAQDAHDRGHAFGHLRRRDAAACALVSRGQPGEVQPRPPLQPSIWPAVTNGTSTPRRDRIGSTGAMR